jgi:hypothetical protein
MLYVYNFIEHFGEKTEIGKAQGLKPFGIEGYYIAETDNIIVEGKNPRIKTLQDFIVDSGCFDCGEVLELDAIMLSRKIEVPKEIAITLLYDDLRAEENSAHIDDILSAENPADRIEKIIRELTLDIVEMVIDNLKSEYRRLNADNLEWK